MPIAETGSMLDARFSILDAGRVVYRNNGGVSLLARRFFYGLAIPSGSGLENPLGPELVEWVRLLTGLGSDISCFPV